MSGEGPARVRAMLWRRVRGAREGAAGDEGERGGAFEEKAKRKQRGQQGVTGRGKEKVKSAREEKQSHSEQKSRSDRATGAKVCEISK